MGDTATGEANLIAQLEARTRQLEEDVEFYTRKLDYIDSMAQQWIAKDDSDMSALECGEALADVLSGYRQRVARRWVEDNAAKA